MKTLSYTPHGTCSRQIDVTLDDDGVIVDVAFTGGCSGNTQGVSALVRGMKADEAVKRLRGIRCGARPTSCPDQLSRALQLCIEQQQDPR
ncbi:MAG: TIGR03905 family TSCPD domain-containing protein [Clostridia bacterium]|nr:TIGR03905 family TSCPD domain-containing protein [Clostridia bacterium]